nr:MAG TPA: hypothetical protein [Caudoviricetes sp.]
MVTVPQDTVTRSLIHIIAQKNNLSTAILYQHYIFMHFC